MSFYLVMILVIAVIIVVGIVVGIVIVIAVVVDDERVWILLGIGASWIRVE